jgi:DNA-binding winged helix-turn-helix (wHTH) protein
MSRLPLGDHLIDLESGDVMSPHGGARLRPMELVLLRRLYAAHGDTVGRERLLVDVWGYARASSSRTLDTTIARLRSHLEPDPLNPAFILTDHGEGYALVRRPPLSGRPIVGREELLARIAARLPGGGWLTLAGPGGIGKTRLLEAVAELPRGGRPLLHVDVPTEGIGALAAAVMDPKRVVLVDLGVAPASVLDAVVGPATVVVASRFILDRHGETVVRVPPVDGRLPLAIALHGRADAVERLRANLASTLSLLSEQARAAWAELPTMPAPDVVDELASAGVVCWREGGLIRAPYLELIDG